MANRQHAAALDLPTAVQTELIAGAHDAERVQGLTHTFYKYPARFSPSFARAVIKAFTKPSDLVMDNHVGGGTTLVEALALGRHAIGVDISTLAEFVTDAKTTVFEEAELKALAAWTDQLKDVIHLHKPSTRLSAYAELGYYKHLAHPSRWRLRKAIEQSLASALGLESKRLVLFGRCLVLRTAQWALDGRRDVPSVDEFRNMLSKNAKEMIDGARQLLTAVRLHPDRPRACVINRSAVGLESDTRLVDWPKPKLILTSPPYPGVHVLYHRWQVEGGKEVPLPFMIANKLDGAGESYYTMGGRKHPMLKRYFDNIRASMSSVAALADEDTVFVQMVAFANPSWQLPQYLAAMEQAGLSEFFLPTLQGERDGRIWRNVPGRRWYSEQRGATPASLEVVLLHKKAL